MKAPSEKHLEDWIYTHQGMLTFIHEGDTLDKVFLPIERQLKLPSGIPDLIAIEDTDNIAVLELKRGAIDSETLAQVCRYMNDIQQIANYAMAELRDPMHPELILADVPIRGVMIGHSVADKHLLAACELLDIWVITYEHYPNAETEYVFTGHSYPVAYRKRNYSQHTESVLGTAIKFCYEQRFNAYIDDPIDFITQTRLRSIVPSIEHNNRTGNYIEYKEHGRTPFEPYYTAQDEWLLEHGGGAS